MLEIDKLVDWIYGPIDEFLIKRARAGEASSSRAADFAMFTSLMEDEEAKTELEMSGLDPDDYDF